MLLPGNLKALNTGRSSLASTTRRFYQNDERRDVSKGPRITYSVVSIFCMLLLATMLGSRLHTFTNRKHGMPLSFIRILVLMLYLAAICFVATSAILQSGLDLSTLASCRAAVYVCLVFYVGSKVFVQLFLVERAHAARYQLIRRRRDWIFLASLAIIILGFGSIAGVAFAYPIADLAASDKRCRIGVPAKVTIPLITYEIVINVALTGVFIAILKPLLTFRKLLQRPDIQPRRDHHKQEPALGATQPRTSIQSAESHIELAAFAAHTTPPVPADSTAKSLEMLVYKSLAGAVTMLIPTIINLGLLFRWKGQEQGWLCFTLCTLDVTWSVAVVHFLTVDHRES